MSEGERARTLRFASFAHELVNEDVNNAEDKVDIAGGEEVEDGLGELMIFLYFLLFGVGVETYAYDASMRYVENGVNMKMPDSGSYWHESTVVVGVRPTRARTCGSV